MSLEDVGLEPGGRTVKAYKRGLYEGLRDALYRGWVRREKKGIQEYKKPATPRKHRISPFVVGTVSD